MELVQNSEVQPCKTKDSSETPTQLTRRQEGARSRLAGSRPSTFCTTLLTGHIPMPTMQHIPDFSHLGYWKCMQIISGMQTALSVQNKGNGEVAFHQPKNPLSDKSKLDRRWSPCIHYFIKHNWTPSSFLNFEDKTLELSSSITDNTWCSGSLCCLRRQLSFTLKCVHHTTKTDMRHQPQLKTN